MMEMEIPEATEMGIGPSLTFSCLSSLLLVWCGKHACEDASTAHEIRGKS